MTELIRIGKIGGEEEKTRTIRATIYPEDYKWKCPHCHKVLGEPNDGILIATRRCPKCKKIVKHT